MAKTNVLLELWYRALSSPLGIEIQCNDVDKVRARLYAERKKIQDADLNEIAICQSPFDPTRAWLVKRKANASS